MGIPHTEVDLILVNGHAENFTHRPASGDHIAVYPVFEALDVQLEAAQLRPVPLRDPRFVVDVNLGRLARLLRVLGFDVWWSGDADDHILVDISLDQQRILLTRDRALLKRRVVTHGLFVHSDDPEEQTLEVLRRLDLRQRLAPLTRCVRCNGRLVAVAKDEVIDRLEPLDRRYYSDFSRCKECGRDLLHRFTPCTVGQSRRATLRAALSDGSRGPCVQVDNANLGIGSFDVDAHSGAYTYEGSLLAAACAVWIDVTPAVAG